MCQPYIDTETSPIRNNRDIKAPIEDRQRAFLGPLLARATSDRATDRAVDNAGERGVERSGRRYARNAVAAGVMRAPEDGGVRGESRDVAS